MTALLVLVIVSLALVAWVYFAVPPAGES